MSESFTLGEFRPPFEVERGYLDRLMSASFPGKAEVAEQLRSSLVRTIDPDGSIEIRPQVEVPAPVVTRIPVEAEAADKDGVPVHFLLHVVDSRAHELEIYKADGSEIRRRPEPEELEVMVGERESRKDERQT